MGNNVCSSRIADTLCGTRAGVALKGCMLVVASPPGVGVKPLVAEVLKRHPRSLTLCVSHTTRQPKRGEEDGINYNFVSRDLMQADIDAGRFVEHVDINGDMYGTSVMELEAVLAKGKICVLDVDVQGVQQVKSGNLAHFTKYAFIMPPSKPSPLKLLEEGLRCGSCSNSSGSEHEGQACSCSQAAIAYAEEDGGSNFDAVIVNDELETAVDQLDAKVREWYRMQLLLLEKDQRLGPAAPAPPKKPRSRVTFGGPEIAGTEVTESEYTGRSETEDEHHHSGREMDEATLKKVGRATIVRRIAKAHRAAKNFQKSFQVGERVTCGSSSLPGTVEFIGTTEFAPGEWIGVRLEEPIGKNDGSVQGKRYFECEPQCGLFVRPDVLERVV